LVLDKNLNGREPDFSNTEDVIEIFYQKTPGSSMFDSILINWYQRSTIRVGYCILKTIPTFDGRDNYWWLINVNQYLEATGHPKRRSYHGCEGIARECLNGGLSIKGATRHSGPLRRRW